MNLEIITRDNPFFNNNSVITYNDRVKLYSSLGSIHIPDSSDLFFGLDCGILIMFRVLSDGHPEETYEHFDNQNRLRDLDIENKSIKSYIFNLLSPFIKVCNEMDDQKRIELKNLIEKLYFPTEVAFKKFDVSSFRKGKYYIGKILFENIK